MKALRLQLEKKLNRGSLVVFVALNVNPPCALNFQELQLHLNLLLRLCGVSQLKAKPHYPA